MKTTERQYKLSIVWKTLDPAKKLIWGDGSQCYIIRKVKIERWQSQGDWVYELYKTTLDMYQPIEDFLVDYAYDHGIEQLSDAITLHGLETRYKSMREGVTEYSKKTEEELISKYKSLKSKVKFNLNEIYESNET